MLSDVDVSRIIEMAWEDRTPFEAIHLNFGVSESDVIKLMQLNLKNLHLNYGEKGFREGKPNMNNSR